METKENISGAAKGPILQKIRVYWETFWFRPASPQSLGICRILFYGTLLYFYLGEDFRYLGELSALSWKPVSFFKILSRQAVLSAEIIGVLQVVWKLSLFTSMIGLFTRYSTGVACVLGFYLLAMTYSVARLAHELPSTAICMAIMIFSHCGHAFSVDRFWAEKKGSAKPLAWDGEYYWPAQLTRVVISIVFFSAGYSKLSRSGLDWIFSDNLQYMLAWRQMGLGIVVSHWSWLCHVLAGLTIITELFHPFALFSKKMALFFVPSGIMMISGFFFLMGIPFPLLICLHLFWIPWDKLLFRPAPSS